MDEQQPSSSKKSNPPKRENTFLNLGFNIILPIVILDKGKDWFGGFLEPFFENVAVGVLLLAVAFPIGYFVYDYIARKKYNIFSILGLISVLLTGGIGILHIPTEWFAIKEAAIPLLLGIAVVVSLKTPYPLIRTLIYNPEVMDVDRVQAALKENDSEREFEKLLTFCTWLLGGAFLISAILNYVLATQIVVSPSGTDAFNEEVSRMMRWSWLVIAIPSIGITMYTLFKLIGGIKKMTGLEMEQVLHGGEEKKAS